MSNILVTGGAGYIGSHACKQLQSEGFTPVTYDNLSRGHRDLVKWGPLEVGDIADHEKLGAVITEYKPAAVLHFAGFGYIAESVQDPLMYYVNNIAGTTQLLQTLRDNSINKIVFSSTCAVYGVAEDLPLTEKTPCQPINPYGRSKLTVEHILRDCSSAYGLKSVSLRYFNAGGADEDGETGEDHDPEPHVLPCAMMTAGGLLPVFDILGDDYPTADGSAIRDYIHVTDLAAAHVAALRYLLNDGDTVSVNLGSGTGFSVREIISAVEKVTGHNVPVNIKPRRAGDPPALFADAGLARELLGFEAKHSDLENIISTAWAWHKTRHDLGRSEMAEAIKL